MNPRLPLMIAMAMAVGISLTGVPVPPKREEEPEIPPWLRPPLPPMYEPEGIHMASLNTDPANPRKREPLIVHGRERCRRDAPEPEVSKCQPHLEFKGRRKLPRSRRKVQS